MKQNKIRFLLFLMLFFNYSFSQVGIDGITVNGTSVNGTSINLNPNVSSSNIYLNVSIQLPVSPADSNYPGSLTIYYKTSSTSNANVMNGGQAIPIQFLGGTFISRSFYLTVLNSSFPQTGGFLYAEYKNHNSTTIIKSANISITKTMATQPNDPGSGSGGGCSECYLENVPYGGIPLLPFSDLINEPSYSWYVLNPFATSEIGPYTIDRASTVSERLNLGLRGPNTNNYRMTYVASVDRPYSRNDNYISRLTINNSITGTQDIAYGGTPQTIVGNSATVNNIVNNNYQWQERIVKKHCDCGEGNYNQWLGIYGWKNISGATQINYTPQSNHTQTKEYRRLIFDNYGIPMASNVVAVHSITTDSTIDNTNVICCNKIYFPNDPISPIVGQNVNLYHYIEWQQGSMNGNIMEWRTMQNETSKDKVPFTTLNRRNPRPYSSTTYYRRILTNRFNGKFYVSNIVSINYTNINGSGRFANPDNKDKLHIEDIVVYPNPSSDIINIANDSGKTISNFKIMDLTGRVVLSKKVSESNFIQLNISELPSGIYNLILENEIGKTQKKIIKN